MSFIKQYNGVTGTVVQNVGATGSYQNIGATGSYRNNIYEDDKLEPSNKIIKYILTERFGGYTELTIYTKNEELQKKYTKAAEKHNSSLLNEHFDSGFDLYCPKYISLSKYDIQDGIEQLKLDHEIQCSAVYKTNNLTYNTGYYLYPRSSVSKTRFRLANSVGIIDSGYRGNIIGVFDVKRFSDEENCDGNNPYSIVKGDRMCQLCAPNLGPIFVRVADRNEEPSSTERGAGGFGSTGK